MLSRCCPADPTPAPLPRTAIGAPNDNQRPPPAPFIGIERGPSHPTALTPCPNPKAAPHRWIGAWWEELTPKSPRYLFIPRDETLAEEYESGWEMTKVFPINSVGIVTGQDKVAIRWSDDEMIQVTRELMPSLGEEMDEELVTPILYRPFDIRYTYNSDHVITRRRHGVMRHMLAGPNVGLCIGRAGQVIGSKTWDVCYVSIAPSDFNLFRRGGNCLFPLYTYPTEGQEHLGLVREPNLGEEFIEAAMSSLGLKFITDGSGDLQESFGPEDVFHYIYAVLHSPEYRNRYADFLKSDFPRVPVTGDRSLFQALVELGERLTSLHLMKSEGEDTPAFPVTGDNRVDKVSYAPPLDGTPGRVFINADQYFDGVTQETWDMSIAGYRPAEKWLKDRRRRTLTYEDITHYRRICAALSETPRLMARIDEKIESHGGWPLG